MKTARPVLFILSGLPGTGKSVLGKLLAERLGAVFLRIDTIEQGLRDLCGCLVQGEGYRLAYRIAADNLRLGHAVVADSCNPLELTRDEWEAVAHETGATASNIEVICSDRAEHRRRVETRHNEVSGLQLPSWAEVESREYHPWTRPHLRIDTAGRLPETCLNELLSSLAAEGI